jgi:hypothetical protein
MIIVGASIPLGNKHLQASMDNSQVEVVAWEIWPI